MAIDPPTSVALLFVTARGLLITTHSPGVASPGFFYGGGSAASLIMMATGLPSAVFVTCWSRHDLSALLEVLGAGHPERAADSLRYVFPDDYTLILYAGIPAFSLHPEAGYILEQQSTIYPTALAAEEAILRAWAGYESASNERIPGVSRTDSRRIADELCIERYVTSYGGHYEDILLVGGSTSDLPTVVKALKSGCTGTNTHFYVSDDDALYEQLQARRHHLGAGVDDILRLLPQMRMLDADML